MGEIFAKFESDEVFVYISETVSYMHSWQHTCVGALSARASASRADVQMGKQGIWRQLPGKGSSCLLLLAKSQPLSWEPSFQLCPGHL